MMAKQRFELIPFGSIEFVVSINRKIPLPISMKQDNESVKELRS